MRNLTILIAAAMSLVWTASAEAQNIISGVGQHKYCLSIINPPPVGSGNQVVIRQCDTNAWEQQWGVE